MSFISVFEIVPRVGYESDLVASAAEMSALFKERFGSLGSRLHRAPDGRFFAYAAWPDKNTWESRAGAAQLAPEICEKFDHAVEMTNPLFESDNIIFSNLERILEDSD